MIDTPKKMIRCLKVTRPECGRQWCVYRMDRPMELLSEFDGADIGETITVELCEMTEQELDDLPEFEGW